MENIDLKTYKGNDFRYLEIGARGDQTLAINILYSAVPSMNATGCIIRFICVTPTEESRKEMFKVFGVRASRTVVSSGDEFDAYSLNLIRTILCKPFISLKQMIEEGDKMNTWARIAVWVEDLAQKEGFMIMPDDLPAVIKSFFTAQLGKDEDVVDLLTLPTLTEGQLHYEVG